MQVSTEKFQNLFIIFMTFISATVFTSCLTVGTQFPSMVTWIKANETTRSEIEKAFGAGLLISGHQYSYGYYKYSAFSESHTKDLTIRFNSNDTVYSYTFSSSFPDDKK